MNEERRDEIVLAEVDPREGTLTAWPFQVGIIMRDGRVEEVFSEGKRSLRRGMFQKGEVRAFIAYTSPFNLIFWLNDPGDPSQPSEGIAFGQPVLTADRQIVTGRIDLTLSVMPNNVEYLLQLLGPRGSAITQPDIARKIRDELSAKVLALDLYSYTASELRGNEELLRGVYCSLKTQLASTICRFGLKLDNFFVNWGLTLEDRERIKDQRHEGNIRDIERVLELEDAKKPKEPAEPEPPQPSLPPPTPPPGPPVSQADRIRRYALEHFVEPARRDGCRNVAIRLGDVQLGLGVRTNVPNFINALSGRKFLEMADLRLLETSGAAAGPNTVFHYEILGHPDPTVQNEQSYRVFTDEPTSKSTIHEESCRFYQNRRSTRLPDNWWHGPYATREQARSSPENVGQVRECGTCRP